MSPEEFVISEAESKGPEGEKKQPGEMTQEEKNLKLANIKKTQINLTFGTVAVIIVLVIFLVFTSISFVPPMDDSTDYDPPVQEKTKIIEKIPFSVTSFGVGSSVHVVINLYRVDDMSVRNSANISILKKTTFVDKTLDDIDKSITFRLQFIQTTTPDAVVLKTNKQQRDLTFDANIQPGDYYIILSNYTNDFKTTVKYRISQNPIGPIVPYIVVVCGILLTLEIIYFVHLYQQKLIIEPKPKKEKKEEPEPEPTVTIKTTQASPPQGMGMSVPPTAPTQYQSAPAAMAPPMGYPPQQPYPQSQYPPRPQSPPPSGYQSSQPYTQPQYPPRQQPPPLSRYPPQQPYPQSQYPPRQSPPMQSRYPPQQHPEQKDGLPESPYEAEKGAEEFDVIAEEPYDLLNPPEAGAEEVDAELEPAEEMEEEVLEPSSESLESPKEETPTERRSLDTPSKSEKGTVRMICPMCSLELTAHIDECPKEVVCGLCGTKTVIRRK